MKTPAVYFGTQIFSLIQKDLKKINPSRVILLYDKNLKKQKNKFLKSLKTLSVLEIPLRAHEDTKSLASVIKIYNKLSLENVDRKAIVVAMGGGVIGDTAGFVASTFLRGIPWINIPTTVLAQVDSGVGGKNGVNLASGKNLVGTFYQPVKVYVDFEFLKTLPAREIASGLGEILKYSYLKTQIRFPELDPQKRDHKKMLKTIQKLTPPCVRFKTKLVQADERDLKGIRQVLNLGHTFGHVLETYTRYKTYRHGEAVVWGLKFASLLSLMKNLMSFEEFRKIMNVANKLPVTKLPKNLRPETCYRLALKDKKSERGQIKMVLLKKRGLVLSEQVVTEDEFKKAVSVLKDMT